MKNLLYLITICTLLIAVSCSSHKASSVKESTAEEIKTSLQVDERLTKISDLKLNSWMSFDSIDILIRRNWNTQSGNENYYAVGREFAHDKFMAIPDSIRGSSTKARILPAEEIINIKAYNAKASDYAGLQDSLSAFKDTSLDADKYSTATKEGNEESRKVNIFDPSDAKVMAIFSFLFAAFILLIIYFFKRKLKT